MSASQDRYLPDGTPVDGPRTTAAEGERYSEAIRGGRALSAGYNHTPAVIEWIHERRRGIPAGWITR